MLKLLCETKPIIRMLNMSISTPLKGIVPTGSTPQHIIQYVLQLNPSAPYIHLLISNCLEAGLDFEVLLSYILVRTNNFADYNNDFDIFDQGQAGSVDEQIFAFCRNGIGSKQTVADLTLSETEEEIYPLVLQDVRQMLRIKRASSQPRPLPKPPAPVIITPRVPATPVPATEVPTKEPTKTPSILSLLPWWVKVLPIVLIVGLVAAFIFIPGASTLLMPIVINILSSIFSGLFKH